MDFEKHQRIADQGRAEMIKNFIHRWKQRSVKKKAIDIGLVAAFTAVSFNLVWPDLHKELEEWNPEYQEACYTHREKADGLASPYTYDYAKELYDVLELAGGYGNQAITDFDHNLGRNVLCVGPAYKGQDVSHWMLTGVTIVNEEYSPTSYAFQLAADEFSSLWSRNVEDMEERLVYRDALLFSRFERAIETTEQIDMFFLMAYETHGAKVFDSPEWQEKINDDRYRAALQAYQNERISIMESYNLESPIIFTNQQDHARVMKATMVAFMQDGDALNEGDLEFMRRYYPQMEDDEEICTGSGENESCVTYDTAPSSWVHSRRINGEIIAHLTSLAHPDQREWLDPMDVADMLRDAALTTLYTDDARNYEERIVRRIHYWNTQKHDTHRPITMKYLVDGFQINQYHQKTEATPIPAPQRYDNRL